MQPGVPALSVRQPWAWLIVNGHKDVENRDWRAGRRGTLLIHASKGLTRREYCEAAAFAAERGVAVPAMEELERGGIVGVVDLSDVVSASRSVWFVGPYGFVMKNPRTLPFVPCRGTLGFFRAESDFSQPVGGNRG
jgi:hypothetical protein